MTSNHPSPRHVTARITMVTSLLTLTLTAFSAAQETAQSIEPLVRTVDLNVGESVSVRLANGTDVTVQLIAVKEFRDSRPQQIAKRNMRIHPQPGQHHAR